MDEHLRRGVQPRVLDTSPVTPFTGVVGVGAVFLSIKTFKSFCKPFLFSTVTFINLHGRAKRTRTFTDCSTGS